MSGTPPGVPLRDLLDAQAIRYWVNAFDSLGMDSADVRRRLERRYGNIHPTTFNALFNRVIQARAAARTLSEGGGNVPLRARDVPRPYPGCTLWQYTVVVTYDRGDGDGPGLYYDTVRSSSSLSASQVIGHVLNNAPDLASDPNRVGGSPPFDAGASNFAARVVAVERACP